ncbi:hypothetical protein BJ741DRAFT_580838 [Chytriomyces cf. hyalinus JEL632]|nr:hypothetical protein BJ741DRAFT_580838 [Chytriomyces cf. hyalinus JEL632]
MSAANITGITLAYPTQQSLTCLVQAATCNTNQDSTNGTINNAYTFCANMTTSANLFTPPNPATNQTALPAGMTCDGTPSACQRSQTYICTCYLDLATSSQCTLKAIADNNGPQSIMTKIQENTLYFALFITAIVLVSLCVINTCWKWITGGHPLSPRGVREYTEERKEIKRQRMRDAEARLDELAHIETNRLRRDQELESLRMQQQAHRAFEAEKAQLAAEKELANIAAQRHALIVADTQRRQALTQMIESSEDLQLQREAERELRAIEARRVQREELQAVSGSTVRVVETARIENGQTTVSYDIHRERIANTDRDAQILMDQVNREKAAHAVPAVTAPAQPSDDHRMML